MANVADLKVGQRVTVRGKAGQLMSVDRPTGQVTVRFDDEGVGSDKVLSASSVQIAPVEPAKPEGAAAATPAAKPQSADAGPARGSHGTWSTEPKEPKEPKAPKPPKEAA